MAEIDIPLSESLAKAFVLPQCGEISLPFPKPLSVHLPTGGSLSALVDMSKGIPNDCGMNFNLMLQMAPLMASLECPLKVLKLLKPLVDIVSGLPVPPPKALSDFAEAAIELAPCFAVFAGIPLMVKDLLCLVRSVLNCLLGQMRTIRDLISGLELRLAEAEGNPDLLAQLQCSKDNANAWMSSLSQSIDPIAGFLALVGIIASVAGQSLDLDLKAPSAPPENLDAINALIDVLQGVVDAIDAATGGSCA